MFRSFIKYLAALLLFSVVMSFAATAHAKKKKKPKGGMFLSDFPSFVGESAYDNAGFGLASVGDVNGDGLQDFVVGSPNNDEGGVNVGKVYLYFGKQGNVWKKSVNLVDAPVTYIGEEKDDNAGSAVAGIGDVNGDGLGDFAICARNNSQGGDGAGKVYASQCTSVRWKRIMRVPSFLSLVTLTVTGLTTFLLAAQRMTRVVKTLVLCT